VVDDYEPWRRFVRSTLEKLAEVGIIGEASDGPQAVQQAQQLQPDLIVLDIGLPTFNGIEAARQIRQLSPNSKLVFLSENRSSDVVEEALRTGANGYVVKSNAARDLSPALEAVIQGQQFVSGGLSHHDRAANRAAKDDTPSPALVLEPYKRDAGSRHAVDFYSEDSVFVAAFANYIEAALKNGNVAVVIASDSHHASIRQRLISSGVDVDAAVGRKHYIPLDLADSLSTVDAASERDRLAPRVNYRTVEAVRTAKEKHLHVALG
jgi:DNA-binding NarL/FixJ family response regulator